MLRILKRRRQRAEFFDFHTNSDLRGGRKAISALLTCFWSKSGFWRGRVGGSLHVGWEPGAPRTPLHSTQQIIPTATGGRIDNNSGGFIKRRDFKDAILEI